MIQEIKTYKTADLVLQVSNNYNPSILGLAAWDRYFDILYGHSSSAQGNHSNRRLALAEAVFA